MKLLMYTRVSKKGTSFKGAALYYLHDDEKATTNKRVAFTRTQNLATDDPEMAWKMMAFTAMNQNEIKKAAGVKATGNKGKSSVYTYFLSWKPSDTFKDKPQPNPTKEEMIEAGLQTLNLLGLHEHESMIIGHNDTAHSHIHIMVNRVHPETGILNTHSKDHNKLSKWAEKHERDRGEILCEARAENNARRLKGEYVKFKEDQTKAEYYRLQREKTKQAFAQKEKELKTLDGIHKKQRQELLDNKEKFLKERLARLKEINRPKWASIYKQQEQESLIQQDELRSSLNRLRNFTKNPYQEREHGKLGNAQRVMSGAYNTIMNGGELENSLNKKHKHERLLFGNKLSGQTRSALSQSNDEYFRKFEELKAKAIKEQQLMRERHSQESQARAKDIASGRSYASYNMKQSFKDSNQPQNDNAPPAAKGNFTRSTSPMEKENKEFDFVNDNYFRDVNDQEKDTGLKDEFNFINDDFLGKSKDKGKGKDSGHSSDKGKDKSAGMDRSL
ncbi:MAG: relaxase/mobilization nuclease domain-containing protein [Deltaproteobacteria bacterium]|nr:relaxase/mobilization nuclease domain-containing protein [Deltaproteobacteria bacterium]